MPGPDISLAVGIHPTGLWLTLPIRVREQVTLLMVFDPGSPASTISPAAELALSDRGLLAEPVGAPSHRLTGLRSQNQRLPDLRVRVLSRLASLARGRIRDVSMEIDGLLGLDFWGNFVEIRFHVPSMTLTLVDP